MCFYFSTTLFYLSEIQDDGMVGLAEEEFLRVLQGGMSEHLGTMGSFCFRILSALVASFLGGGVHLGLFIDLCFETKGWRISCVNRWVGCSVATYRLRSGVFSINFLG